MVHLLACARGVQRLGQLTARRGWGGGMDTEDLPCSCVCLAPKEAPETPLLPHPASFESNKRINAITQVE